MKKDLQEKLGKYTALAGAMLTTGGFLHGQAITYTIAGDTLNANGDIALIDLDQDGTNDFAVGLVNTTYGGNDLNVVTAAPYGSQNAIAGSAPSGYNYPTRFDVDDDIGSGVNWLPANSSGTMAFFYNGQNPYGENWNGGVTDGYLGMQLVTGAGTFYGWARIDINADNTFVLLKDYAVYMIDGKTIKAGQTIAAGINYVDMIGAEVYAANQQVYVTLPQDVSAAKVRVTNVLGQVVYEGIANSGREEISLQNANAGIYIVTLESENAKFVKKVVIN